MVIVLLIIYGRYENIGMGRKEKKKDSMLWDKKLGVRVRFIL